MNYAEAIEYILSFSDMERGYQASVNPTMSLESMRSLLSRLNDPHVGRGTVHVTGSKGKGSTAAMVANILRQAGQGVALYTSPHLHSFTERIVIDEGPISTGEFAAGLTGIQHAIEAERESVHGNVSTFGILTALFFWLARAQARRIDWQVVEVGLGGTYDATNVFDAPDVVVITPVSLEHTAILGDTPAAIAADKAGIIKKGCTCVLAPQQDRGVLDMVRRRCDEVGARLIDVGSLYHVEPIERFIYGQSCRLTGPGLSLELRTPMLGRHQLDNAATAVAAAEALRRRGVGITPGDIVTGVGRTRLPGRVEVMGRAPLIVTDGAHNGESAAALAETLRDYLEWRRLFLVLGVTQDKDLRAIVFQLAKLAELIVCCRFRNPRSMDPLAMVQEAGFLGPAAVAEESVAEGIETALSHAAPEDVVCITGSLYVVAEARQHVLGDLVVSE